MKHAIFMIAGLLTLGASQAFAQFHYKCVTNPGSEIFYTAANAHEAIGICQNHVNETVVAFCDGRTDLTPITIEYRAFFLAGNPYGREIIHDYASFRCGE